MVVATCDRCKKQFEYKRGYSAQLDYRLFNNGNLRQVVGYDFCPECMKDFKNWASGAEEKQTGWISVKDRLPDQELLEHMKRYQEKSVEVLVMIKGGKIATALTWDGNSFSDGIHNEYEVTHWMPLPEPPGDSDAQD